MTASPSQPSSTSRKPRPGTIQLAVSNCAVRCISPTSAPRKLRTCACPGTALLRFDGEMLAALSNSAPASSVSTDVGLLSMRRPTSVMALTVCNARSPMIVSPYDERAKSPHRLTDEQRIDRIARREEKLPPDDRRLRHGMQQAERRRQPGKRRAVADDVYRCDDGAAQ